MGSKKAFDGHCHHQNRERLFPELGTVILAPREEEVEGERSISGLKAREILSSN